MATASCTLVGRARRGACARPRRRRDPPGTRAGHRLARRARSERPRRRSQPRPLRSDRGKPACADGRNHPRTSRRWRSGSRPCGARPTFTAASLRTAENVAAELLASPRDVTVLHGDIHHGNILDFGARGWLAVDPKGLVGERGLDYANLFCNPDTATATGPGRSGAATRRGRSVGKPRTPPPIAVGGRLGWIVGRLRPRRRNRPRLVRSRCWNWPSRSGAADFYRFQTGRRKHLESKPDPCAQSPPGPTP